MTKHKIISVLLIAVVLCSVCLLCCSCEDMWNDFWDNFPDKSFSAKWITTEDGFSYYVDKEIGLCIMRFPDQDEITIPEYIDGMRVIQLCYKDKPSLGFSGDHGVTSNVKKLTITHTMNLFGASNELYTKFPLLEELVLIDCWNAYVWNISNNIIRIDFSTRNDYGEWVHPNISLIKGEKNIVWDKANINTIEIPQCVTVIENGVFDGIENVIIKTSYENKPEGWQDGWNSSLDVEWGVEF